MGYLLKIQVEETNDRVAGMTSRVVEGVSAVGGGVEEVKMDVK